MVRFSVDVNNSDDKQKKFSKIIDQTPIRFRIEQRMAISNDKTTTITTTITISRFVFSDGLFFSLLKCLLASYWSVIHMKDWKTVLLCVCVLFFADFSKNIISFVILFNCSVSIMNRKRYRFRREYIESGDAIILHIIFPNSVTDRHTER